MPKCYQTRVIEAPIEKVWSAIKNFHDLSWTPNVVTSVEKVGMLNGDEVGAKRVLNDAFHETLLAVCDKSHTFSYSIDEGVSPVSSKEVSNYVGNVKLFPVTLNNQTFIEWESSWEANNPEAEEFCHSIYVSMMNDLNESLK